MVLFYVNRLLLKRADKVLRAHGLNPWTSRPYMLKTSFLGLGAKEKVYRAKTSSLNKLHGDSVCQVLSNISQY